MRPRSVIGFRRTEAGQRRWTTGSHCQRHSCPAQPGQPREPERAFSHAASAVLHLVAEAHHPLNAPHSRGQQASDLVALRPPRQRDNAVPDRDPERLRVEQEPARDDVPDHLAADIRILAGETVQHVTLADDADQAAQPVHDRQRPEAVPVHQPCRLARRGVGAGRHGRTGHHAGRTGGCRLALTAAPHRGQPAGRAPQAGLLSEQVTLTHGAADQAGVVGDRHRADRAYPRDHLLERSVRLDSHHRRGHDVPNGMGMGHSDRLFTLSGPVPWAGSRRHSPSHSAGRPVAVANGDNGYCDLAGRRRQPNFGAIALCACLGPGATSPAPAHSRLLPG